MTLDEKIGQMTQPEQDDLKDPADIEKLLPRLRPQRRRLRSQGRQQPRGLDRPLRPLPGSTPARRASRSRSSTASTPSTATTTCSAPSSSRTTSASAARAIPQLVEKVHRVTAEEVRATGINWAFAPCVTVPQDERWGRTYEGFSEDPAAGRRARRGRGARLPGRPTSADPARACSPAPSTSSATAAPPCGSGHSNGKGLDQGDTRVDEATLRRIHLPGYIAAIKAGVGTIMPSYSSWNGVKCSASKHLLTDILKDELGFEGFLISDYNAIDQIAQRLQGRRRHLDQRRHGHGDGAHDRYTRVHQRPQGARRRRQGADGAHRRRRHAHPARQVRHGPAGHERVAAGRSQPAEDLRLARASRRRAPGRARVAGAAQERRARRCRCRRRPRASTSPARAPTTSATSAAAGPSTGRARAATSPPAAPRSSPPSGTPSPRTPRSPSPRTAPAPRAPPSASS